MTAMTPFRSVLAEGIQRFLATKRALGRRYRSEERELRLLDRFLAEQGVTEINAIDAPLLEAFLASRPRRRARSFNHLAGVLRCLFDWLVAQEILSVSPLRALRRRETAARIPFLFDVTHARRLLEAAAALPDRPKGPERGRIYYAIFALLYGLGLRVGEACQLKCGDVDLEQRVLGVRGGKFGKTRLVPFGPRIAKLLQDHLRYRERERALDAAAPLFSFGRQRAVHPGTVSITFLHLARALDFERPPGVARPRLHDLRHSFAVGTLLRWYREGQDLSAKLHHLSTFLGHVDPVSTAVYLTITEDLLRHAGQRFESFAAFASSEATP